MQNDQINRTVFTDSTTNHTVSDDHDLILQVIPFRKNYFVSFSTSQGGRGRKILAVAV